MGMKALICAITLSGGAVGLLPTGCTSETRPGIGSLGDEACRVWDEHIGDSEHRGKSTYENARVALFEWARRVRAEGRYPEVCAYLHQHFERIYAKPAEFNELREECLFELADAMIRLAQVENDAKSIRQVLVATGIQAVGEFPTEYYLVAPELGNHVRGLSILLDARGEANGSARERLMGMIRCAFLGIVDTSASRTDEEVIDEARRVLQSSDEFVVDPRYGVHAESQWIAGADPQPPLLSRRR